MLSALSTFARRKALARQLRHSDPQRREAAINELGEMKALEDVELIASALRDDAGIVRKAAARVLGEFRDPRAVQPLTESLSNPDGSCHTEILFALEQIKDTRSLEACTTSMTSHDAKVRRAAAAALGSLAAISSIETLAAALSDEDEGVVRQAADALAKVGLHAIPALIQALEQGSNYSRQAAATALGTIANPKAIPALIAALRDPDTFVQIAAAKSLSRFDDPIVIKALIEALEDSATAAFFYGVREEAEGALLKMGERAIEPFILTLRDPASRGRLFIVKLMEQVRSPRTYDALVEVTADPNPEIRKAALLSLVALNPMRARPFLQQALVDPIVYVRRTAAQALENSGWEPAGLDEKVQFAIAQGKFFSVLYQGAEGANYLLPYLYDGDPVTRRDVAKAFARLQNPQYLEPLRVMAISEQHGEVQAAVIEAIEACGPAGVESLVFLLEGSDWSLRRIAAQSLSKQGWQPTTSEQQMILGLATENADLTVAGAAGVPEKLQAILEQETDKSVQGTAFLAFQRLKKSET